MPTPRAANPVRPPAVTVEPGAAGPGEHVAEHRTQAAGALSLHVYRFRLRALGPVEFTTFPGPALRGALGDDRAAYAAFFRPPPVLPQARFADPPRPLVLRPRFGAGCYGEGSVLELDVTLAGRAATHLPALIRAVATVAEGGIGPARHAGGGRLRLERADALLLGGAREAVVSEDGRVRPVVRPWRFPDDFMGPEGAGERSGFTLALRSPTFIRRGDEPRGTLEFAAVVDDLLRRVSLLGQGYDSGPVFAREHEEELLAAARAVQLADAAVRWAEVPRYSRNQRAPMTFGGWMGTLCYGGDPAPFEPVLRAAALLHVGKHTGFGFGQVHLGGYG